MGRVGLVPTATGQRSVDLRVSGEAFEPDRFFGRIPIVLRWISGEPEGTSAVRETRLDQVESA